MFCLFVPCSLFVLLRCERYPTCTLHGKCEDTRLQNDEREKALHRDEDNLCYSVTPSHVCSLSVAPVVSPALSRSPYLRSITIRLSCTTSPHVPSHADRCSYSNGTCDRTDYRRSYFFPPLFPLANASLEISSFAINPESTSYRRWWSREELLCSWMIRSY